MTEREELLRTVYECQSCPESYGFTRPDAGRAYFKFPPIIGAVGRADLLFVGINPRRAGNEALHDALMADFGAFERLARNWDGHQTYIASGGPEPHYRAHVGIVQRVFGQDARFEDHAAVTELYLCASPDSTRLPPGSRCADRYLTEVLRLVEPRVVICVGGRVFKYFRRWGKGLCVLRMPHPNEWLSRE